MSFERYRSISTKEYKVIYMSFLNQIDIHNCKLMRKDHLSLCCWELKDGSASSIGCSLGSTNRHSLKE
jgi:hypothetical protein